jgi:hypothetical protein
MALSYMTESAAKQPAAKSKSKRKAWFWKPMSYIAMFLLGNAAVAGIFWRRIDERFFQPSPKIVVELIHKFSEPKGNSYKIQVLTITNIGKKQAEDITVRIDYPRLQGMLNYTIESREAVSDLLRTDDYLSFKLRRLAYAETVIVALNASAGSAHPNDISVIYQNGKVELQDVKEK